MKDHIEANDKRNNPVAKSLNQWTKGLCMVLILWPWASWFGLIATGMIMLFSAFDIFIHEKAQPFKVPFLRYTLDTARISGSQFSCYSWHSGDGRRGLRLFRATELITALVEQVQNWLSLLYRQSISCIVVTVISFLFLDHQILYRSIWK